MMFHRKNKNANANTAGAGAADGNGKREKGSSASAAAAAAAKSYEAAEVVDEQLKGIAQRQAQLWTMLKSETSSPSSSPSASATASPPLPADMPAFQSCFWLYHNHFQALSTVPTRSLSGDKKAELHTAVVDPKAMDILQLTLDTKFPEDILRASMYLVQVLFALYDELASYKSGEMAHFVRVIGPLAIFLGAEFQDYHELVLTSLWNLSNIDEVRDELVRTRCVDKLVELCNAYQMEPHKQVCCLSALNNICMTDSHRKVFADADAVQWLIPLTFSKKNEVRFKSSLLICSIATSSDPSVRDYVQRNKDALDRVIDCILSLDVTKVSSGIWNLLDIEHFTAMAQINIVAVQCFASFCLANVVVGRRSQAIPPSDVLIKLAQSSYPPTRALAIQSLSTLMSQLPREVLLPPSHSQTENLSEMAALRSAFLKFETLMRETSSNLKQLRPSSSKKPDSYDVFISYRQSNGGQLASLIKVHLEKRGLVVFLDIDRLGAGLFDEALITTIESTPNFIAVWTEGALDRCVNEGDWVRREIATAIKAHRNILPVTVAGFRYPEKASLPEDIRPVIQHNSVEWQHAYQSACIDKICSFLTNSDGTGGNFTSK